MFKELIDIDTRKVTAILGLFVALALPIAHGDISLDYVIPANWIPYAKADLGFFGWAATIIIGIHNVAALISPRENPLPTK
jgi:hypothetical protein